MTNSKSTKKALLLSVLSLLLCFSMLIGTTFAWFTDSVSSANNIITAGNLDIELEYWNGEKWVDVSGKSDILTNDLWEPGVTEVAYLRIANAGSLALKYQLGVNIVSETEGINAEGHPFLLSNYIEFGVVENVNGETDAYANRNAAVVDIRDAKDIAAGYTKTGSIKAGADPVYLALVVYMPTDVGNEANHNGTNVPQINLGISVMATQVMAEDDSFGDDYDADALICDILATPDTLEEILANAEPGTVIGLSSKPDDRYAPIVIPAGKNGLTLVSNGALTDSLNINGNNDITIDGITFQAFYKQIETTKYAGNYQYTKTGYLASITNTTETSHGGNNIVIRNCTFTSNPAWLGQGYGENYVPDKYCAINIEDQNRVSGPSTNITIENCTFAAASLNHIRLNYVEGDVVIRNNTFTAPSAHHNINATGNGANWLITGNTFSNWADGEYAFGTSRDGSSETTFITITDNAFNKAMVAGATTPVLSIKTSYTADNSVVTIENNEFNAGNATISAPDASGKYWMTAETTTVGTYQDVYDALASGGTVEMVGDVSNNKQTESNSYGKTAYNQTNGGVLDGNGNTMTVTGANGTWDSAINTTGGTIKDLTIDGGFRGIFINHNSTNCGKVYLENVIIMNSTYTISCDQGTNNGLEATNCVFNGWTSYAASLGDVTFTNCSFGKGAGYAFCRPYATTTFVGCDFAEGYTLDASAAVTFENCTINGVALTAENLSTLVVGGISNVTVK